MIFFDVEIKKLFGVCYPARLEFLRRQVGIRPVVKYGRPLMGTQTVPKRCRLVVQGLWYSLSWAAMKLPTLSADPLR